MDLDPKIKRLVDDTLKDLFSDKEKQLSLSKSGRKRMESEFNWMKAAKAYEEIYSETIKEFHN